MKYLVYQNLIAKTCLLTMVRYIYKDMDLKLFVFVFVLSDMKIWAKKYGRYVVCTIVSNRRSVLVFNSGECYGKCMGNPCALVEARTAHTSALHHLW
jgi:hypothetical protein